MTTIMSIDDLHAFLEREFPQVSHLGMRVEHVDRQIIRVRIPIVEKHLRPGGTVSGPTLMTLADATTYLLILAQIGPVVLAVTTNLNINFLRKPAAGQDVLAEAKLLKLGKRLAVAEVGLFSANDPDPVAHATLTYSIPPNESGK